MSTTSHAVRKKISRLRVDMRGRDGCGAGFSPAFAGLSAGTSGMGCTAMLGFPPLALTLFGRVVLVRGSQARGRHVRGSFGRYLSRDFGRCFGGHFLLVEKSESSTITQFPESIQEKDGGETQ